MFCGIENLNIPFTQAFFAVFLLINTSYKYHETLRTSNAVWASLRTAPESAISASRITWPPPSCLTTDFSQLTHATTVNVNKISSQSNICIHGVRWRHYFYQIYGHRITTPCCGWWIALSLRRFLCTSKKLIDGVRFWVIFVVPSAAVSRHGRSRVKLHNVYPQYGGGNTEHR